MKREELVEAIFTGMQNMRRAATPRFHNLIGQYGLTPSQLELLLMVKARSTITAKELAGQLHMTPGGITQFVEALVQSGYIQRTQDSFDRRITHLTISDAGRKKLAALKQHRLCIMEQIMCDLTSGELQVMLRVQQKMLRQMEEAAKGETKGKME